MSKNKETILLITISNIFIFFLLTIIKLSIFRIKKTFIRKQIERRERERLNILQTTLCILLKLKLLKQTESQ